MENRVIKFRAWDIEGKIMLRVTALYDDGLMQGVRGDQVVELETSEAYVMQFTGLLDKNGKEIYEGDIVRQLREPNFVPSDRPYDRLVIVEAPEYPTLLTISSGGADGEDVVIEQEVVGNIYENPELIQTQAATVSTEGAERY